MSASQEPDISDIHSTTVAETLSVSTSDPPSIVQPVEVVGGVSLPNVPVSQPLTVNVSVPNDTQQSIPAVGASISVGGDAGHVGAGASMSGITDRASTALLNIASNSLNLTEILNAQQQALEQFQCQLQLAQQTEAINQRLDAIERTLNSLIQQKAQEDAAKNQQQVVVAQQQQQQVVQQHTAQQVQVHEVASLQAQQQAAQVQLGGATLSATTPVRPSQQLHMSPSAGSESDSSKKKKLPRELCSKVRSLYHSLNLDFKIDERFLSPTNQRVTDALIDNVYSETSGIYSVKNIKRSAHRYYESRRRLGIEELPDRQIKAAEQRKKRKYRARQQRAFDRRKKYVRETEVRYWDHMTPACMTEESDSENGEKIITHQLLWRSEFMNQFIVKLDSRYDRSKKPGTGSTVKRERISGLPSTSQPPMNLQAAWMIDPTYKISTESSVSSVCISDPTVNPSQQHEDDDDDVNTYTTLIADVQEVHDESSDFELPDAVVA